MFTKRITIFILVIFVVSMVLGACTPKAKAPDVEGETISYWHVWGDGEPAEAITALVDRFNAENEWDITVEAFEQGQWNDLPDAVNVAIQSGDLPDVTMAYSNDAAVWYSVGEMVDLNTYIYDEDFGLTDDEISALYPAAFDGALMMDGVRAAYPFTQSANVMVYNFTWAEELGFDSPPDSPEALKEQLCAARDANTEIGGDFAGTGGMVFYPSNSNWLSFVFAFGGYPLNDAGDAYDFTSQAEVDASLFLLDLKAGGCVFEIDGYPNPEQAMRKALITLSSVAGLPYYADAFEDAGNTTDVWGWLGFPGPDGGLAVDAYQQMIAIAASTDAKQMASWLFIKWLTAPEQQAEWIHTSGYYPTQTSTEPLLVEYGEANPIWATGLALTAIGPSEPQAFPAWSSVRREIGDAVAQIWNAADEAEVRAILQTLTDTANELVEEIE